LAETYKPELLGSNAFEKAQVRQWVEFAGLEINRNSKALIYPLLGFMEYNEVAAKAATADLKEQLLILNKHLQGKSFVVGSNVTLADITLFSALRYYFTFVLVEDQRKKVYANITNWFTALANGENALKVFGRTVLCKIPLKAPKSEKKEEPKKEEPKKKEEKPAAKKEGEEDDDQPKKKKANPLDLLPPTTFVLDEFKKEFLNTTEKAAVLKSFWDKIDLNGFSFWWMEYQKLPSEGKILFKTCNSSSFFLQKLDPFRKYCFGAHGVYGVEGGYEIRGVWMWRGTEIADEIKEHDNFPYMTIKKLDGTQEADRKLIEEYWLNL
jgi:elongation factor 1-gamma